MNKIAAILLGIGLGGFVDGIVLHQILQWHHLLSHVEDVSTVAGLQINTLADGIFHVFAWICTAVGLVLVIASRRHAMPGAAWAGLILTGWGSFNLVEGLVNHQLLGIHHVRDDLGGPVAWDLGFLAVAVVQIALGFSVYRWASRESAG